MAQSSHQLLQELVTLLGRHVRNEQLQETPIPGLQLMRLSWPSRPLYANQWPCLAVLAQGAKSLSFGEETLRYGPGQYLLSSVDLPVVSQVIEASASLPMLGMAVRLEAAEIREAAGRLANPGRLPTGSTVAVLDAPAPFLEAVVRYARLLDEPQQAAGLAPVLRQEILYRLLTGPASGRLLWLAQVEGPGHGVGRALDLLKTSFASPLKVEDLANEAGMSPSSFHYHFKSIYRMTPIAYQKQLRLQEARRLMLVERSEVGEASFQVGYQSPSQFSKDYRRYFGLSPRQDLQTLAHAPPRLTTYLPLSG